MASIPQKELRNNVGEVLRRAEAGEELTITVAGRPVATLGPVRRRQWVDLASLAELPRLPDAQALMDDIRGMPGGDLLDPFE